MATTTTNNNNNNNNLPPLQKTNNKNPSTIQKDAWTSIDNVLKQMTNELKVGEMVHDETSFNLFHAMSATELMDPKMDLGMDRVHIVPTKERLEKEQIKLNLSLIETIRVMDMVLGYEILHFFQGTSYAQTLNTCFYAQKEVLAKLQEQFYAGSKTKSEITSNNDTKNNKNNNNNKDDGTNAALTLANLKISDNATITESIEVTLARVLHAYMVAVIKTAKIIQDKVLQVDIYEEDDFHPRSYNVYMADDVDEKTLVNLLKIAELSSLKYSSSDDDMPPLMDVKGNTDTIIDTSKLLWDGIVKRIRFRLELFQGYHNMLDANDVVSDEKILTKSLDHFETCAQHLNSILESKDFNEKEIWPITKSPEDDDNNTTNNNNGNNKNTKIREDTASSSVVTSNKNSKSKPSIVEQTILKLAFDTALAAEVMPHAPPHSFEPIKLHEACTIFLKSMNDIVFVLNGPKRNLSTVSRYRKAIDQYNKQTRPTRFPSIDLIDPLTHLDLFLQEIARRNCDIIVRTFLSSMLKIKTNIFGLGSITGIALASLQSFGVPNWMTDNKEEGIPCLTAICNSLIYYWRVMCLGPARQHRRLIKVLKDWGNLQYHADFHDEQLLVLYNVPLQVAHNYINRFGSWVLSRGLFMMIHQLELGVGNNLYNIEDNISVLWYMEQLLNTASQNITACVGMYRRNEFNNPTGKYKNEVFKAFGGKKVPESNDNDNNVKKKKKKKKKKKPNKQPAERAATPYHVYMLNYLHAKRAETSGLYEALIGLRKAGLTEDIRKNKFSFGSPEHRYNARFKHFYVFDQQPPKTFLYCEFAKSVETEENEKGDATDIIKSAIELLKKAVDQYKTCQTKIFDNLKNDLYNAHYNFKKKNNLTNFVTLSKILRDDVSGDDAVEKTSNGTGEDDDTIAVKKKKRKKLTLNPEYLIGDENY